MSKFRKAIYIILYVIAVFLASCLYLSLLRNTDSRYLKILDFPRIQFFIATLICIIALLFVIRKWRWYDYLIIVALAGGLVADGSFLINYTPLVAVDVPTAKDVSPSESELSILLTNVKMSNKEFRPLLNLIKEEQPDMVLAMEVNEWWDEKLRDLIQDYPYSQHTINEVAYGMVLYSKFPLQEIKVEYLQHDDVPSFESTFILKNGKTVSLHCIHPVPPTRFEDLPDNAGKQEVALEILGRKLQDRKFPTIVAGDLNDVVWSYVDELTDTKNILYDVRVGRGFYNTYNVDNFFMAWPLDHVFVTDEFKLKSLKRMPNVGSDHYPILVKLVL